MACHLQMREYNHKQVQLLWSFKTVKWLLLTNLKEELERRGPKTEKKDTPYSNKWSKNWGLKNTLKKQLGLAGAKTISDGGMRK